MRINSVFFAIAVSSVLACSPSFSATWTEVSALAEKNNNELTAAKKELESKEWQYKKALTSFLPQVSASGGYGRTDTSSAGATSTSYGLSATQPIFSGFDNLNSAKKAYAQMQYSGAALEQKRSDILYSVRSAFIDLYIAENDLELQERILKRREENSKLIKLLYDNGKEDKGNYMLTLADVESSRSSFSQAKRSLELAKLKLSQLIGTKIEKADIPDIYSKAPEDQNTNALSEKSPSYSMAKATLDIAAISANEALSGLLPDISASGSIRRSGTDWPPQTESKSWSVNFSYSFFPGGSNIAEKIIKDIDKAKAEQDFEQSKKDILYSIESAHSNLAAKVESLNVKDLYLKASTERAKIAQTKYINGLMSYNDWDNIENSYIASEKDFLSAKKEALLAEAAWKNSYGGWTK